MAITDHPDLRDIATQHAQMLELAILAGHPNRAFAVVKRAFDILAEADEYNEMSLCSSILNQRIATILSAGGVHTIGDLVRHNRHSLAQIHGLRYRSVDLIEQKISLHGFKLSRVENQQGGESKVSDIDWQI